MPSSSDNDLSKSFEPTPIDKAICNPPKTTSNTTVTKISSPSSSTSRVNKHYQPKFKKEWLSNSFFATFLREYKADQTKTLCITCNIQFSIQNSGLGDINHHIQTEKHQDQNRIDVAYNVTTTELNKSCAVEGAMVFYTVKHSHSYILHACTINIIKKCFPDSSTAKNITCDKTKAREIACNVLAPSLTRNVKMVPIVVQFFSKTGVKHGILEFIEQMHESADDLFANIKYVLEANELKLNQLVSLGSDNTNVNVGNHHSVFALFEKLLPGLIKEQKVIIKHIRLRWLSLLRSIERLISIHTIVKSYFLNLTNDDCPELLLEFFTSDKSNEFSECTLYFLAKLTEVQNANLLLQRHYTTGVIAELLENCPIRRADDLKKSFRLFVHSVIDYIEKYYNNYKSLCQSISIFDEVHIEQVEWKSAQQCSAFVVNQTIDLDERFDGISKQVESFILSNLGRSNYNGTSVNHETSSCDDCNIQDNLDDSDVSNDEPDVKNKHKETNKSIRPDHLWAYLLDGEHVPSLRKLVEFVFAIPGSNAFCESVFSHKKYLWHNNRTKMKHDLVGAELKIKINTDLTCTEFYDYLLTKLNILHKIRSSDKYSQIAKTTRIYQ
ncbi:unnamed protein product [Rotaria socialis]